MTGLVVAGEDSGKKQVREIEELLASAAIVVAIPHQAVAQAFRPEGAPLLDATVAAERKDLTPEGVSYSGDNSGWHESPVTPRLRLGQASHNLWCFPRCRWMHCSTITLWNLRSASAGLTPRRARPRA